MSYIGKISEVLEDGFSVRVVVPGVCEDPGMPALPERGELDEPKIGDIVVVEELDPVFGSILLYRKIKQNKFHGLRYHGKAISFSDEELTIQTFDPSQEYQDDVLPEGKSIIKITKDNNIEVTGGNNLTITIEGDATVKAQKVTIDGTCKPSGNHPSGGFNCIPICPFTGATHQSNMITK